VFELRGKEAVVGNEAVRLLVFATLATMFGVVAHRSAIRLGLPAMTVPVVGSAGAVLLSRVTA
jgi:hypothetical protein